MVSVCGEELRVNLSHRVFADDGSVAYYLGDRWLAWDEDPAEAAREAVGVVKAFWFGAGWAREEFPGLLDAKALAANRLLVEW